MVNLKKSTYERQMNPHKKAGSAALGGLYVTSQQTNCRTARGGVEKEEGASIPIPTPQQELGLE